MTAIISIKGLGKKYRLQNAGDGTRYKTLREELMGIPCRLFGRKVGRHVQEEFWALRDVSFDVKSGERLGIIGRNGAGKSTLLKLLSRITEPSAGRITLRGRVASLLEVGTGFHPELSGRENIYLNGAILGMHRSEIKRKFDEIVDFAGVEKFLDTPVKRYSSGMYVRLAFAVAAHLSPEILIIDEVLAVGDAEFQKKCLGKMDHISQESGTTVLFVSHNMLAIERFCSRALVLDKGIIDLDGEPLSCISHYFKNLVSSRDSEWTNTTNVSDETPVIPRRFAIIDASGKVIDGAQQIGSALKVELEVQVNQIHPSLKLGFQMYTEDMQPLFISFHTDMDPCAWPKLKSGINILTVPIPTTILNEGTYCLEFVSGLHNIKWFFAPQGNGNPRVSLTMVRYRSQSPFWTSRRAGPVSPVLKWEPKDIYRADLSGRSGDNAS
ncbi:polysaccharide ABC transporter ATP-binding protein [Desulfocurvibacter africanus]|uniref:ABC transporter ATP-binding protein n=1 Tax=Desulfocurvibacter africanus TaxID=873 RepID=UPI00040FCBDE|nr:polysaccharide ABC transporter ATP-binding protein [Desulfocurvibacter africanus]